ncbi:MAG: PrsW family glutamic-type intramembrane protease [Acidimicrobiia bacterium]|nr:PrsW family glutamic-type intramembrane protease [Acidimicrobiia bacterium]
MTRAADHATVAGPGWYPDPWGVSPWRWWDGMAWTVHLAGTPDHKPRLPSWLSVPVLIGSVVTVPLVVLLTVVEPVAILLGLVPLLIVLPVLAWLDRVEPEPRSSRIHAVLWGATVAGVVSGIVNTIVAGAAGETAAAVVSAPLVEEAMKGLGVLWAVRRREVDSVIDGIVYAGWVALGFAVVEDFLYFVDAAADGFLVQIFVLRALFTPFAHPLFTSWIGLAIGLAVTRRQSLAANAAWGYGLAVVSHAAWNGSLTYAERSGNNAAVGIAALCFVGLFFAAVVTVILIRRAQQQRFVAAAPMLAQRYGVTATEAHVFSNWRVMLTARRRLPRSKRAGFDAVHAAMARLALLHERPGALDTVAERRLVDQLHRARAAASVA